MSIFFVYIPFFWFGTSIFSQDGRLPQPAAWSEAEKRVLVEYVALFSPTTDESVPLKWPSCKDPLFWSKCAEAVACTTGLPRRLGMLFTFFLVQKRCIELCLNLVLTTVSSN